MWKKKILKDDEFSRLTEELEKCKVKCKHCGHKIIIFKNNKALCDYCGYYVFKTPKDEFIYRMNERIRRENEK